jgi:hypothetical protein
MFKISLVVAMLLGVVFVAHSASAAFVAKPGDLLRTASDQTVVLVMDNGTRIPVSADGFALRYNNNFGLVKTVTDAERGDYTGNALTLSASNSLAPGSVFLYNTNQPGIYIIQDGQKRLFSTLAGFNAGGNNLNLVQWAGQFTEYPTGVPIQ